MNQHEEITTAAIQNYSHSTPWPEKDTWHNYTFSSIKRIVEHWISIYTCENIIILNAGSGGTEYETSGKLIHLDIVEKYICHFEQYIIGSIENISLPDMSVDGIICVGSVINYADVQQAITEFFRVLKPGGFLILEFERSNSAEFLCTKYYGKYIFPKEYSYNSQTHILWMYSEKHIRQLLKNYSFRICKCRRIHSLSSLLYRLGLSEAIAAPYSKFDHIIQLISYPIAHNTMLFAIKENFFTRNDG